ncbi:MAG TPA: hypothetical protein VIL04_02580 [Solirubrobacterales bacterium]|jgi:hypothetical protein
MNALRDRIKALELLGAVVAVLSLLLALAFAPAADARALLPPKGKVFHGVSETGHTEHFDAFAEEIGSHPAVSQSFFHWGVPLGTGALQRWEATRTRGVLSLSTAPGGKPEKITPKQIALGHGDRYLLSLNRSISKWGQNVYIRLLPEMNGHWNPYSAFNANGTRRGADHSAKWYRKAWRRFAIVVRGGARKTVNRQLRKEKLPRLLRATSDRAPIYDKFDVPSVLPRPSVALLWVPLTFGSPDVKGNQPHNYWPGAKYVDWVGTDIYAKYANGTAWRALNRFYRTYRKKPFLIGEYAPWDADPGGAFVKRLFSWARKHPRARMLIYYRSVNPFNEFNIGFYPDARETLREELAKPRYAPYPPEYRD